MPIPWLARMDLEHLWSWYNLEVWGIELLMFGVLSPRSCLPRQKGQRWLRSRPMS